MSVDGQSGIVHTHPWVRKSSRAPYPNPSQPQPRRTDQRQLAGGISPSQLDFPHRAQPRSRTFPEGELSHSQGLPERSAGYPWRPVSTRADLEVRTTLRGPPHSWDRFPICHRWTHFLQTPSPGPHTTPPRTFPQGEPDPSAPRTRVHPNHNPGERPSVSWLVESPNPNSTSPLQTTPIANVP